MNANRECCGELAVLLRELLKPIFSSEMTTKKCWLNEATASCEANVPDWGNTCTPDIVSIDLILIVG
jgi:hypothetical protein